MKTQKRSIYIDPTPIQQGKVRGAWLWDATLARQDSTIPNMERTGITELYIPYETYVTIADWRSFIRSCRIKGIGVHALHGDPAWGLTPGLSDGLAAIQAVINYNNQVTLNERFTGFQMDVESYLTPLWSTGPEGHRQVSIQWVANMRQFANAARGGGMMFGAALPWWLDDEKDADPSVTPLHLAFMNFLDYYAIMAYSDKPQTTIDYVTKEIAEPAAVGKIMIGYELTEQAGSVSFFEEGYGPLQDSVRMVNEQFAAAPGYRGIALHDLPSWVAMVDGGGKLRTATDVKTSKREVNPS